MTDDDEEFDWDAGTVQFGMDCPYCERCELFDEAELTPYAWIIGHIQEAHADKLPEYGAVE